MNTLGLSTMTPTGGIVVGVDGSEAGREAVRAAALSAAGAGTVLHLVANYEPRKNHLRRGLRDTSSPGRSRGDAEGLAADAARYVTGLGVVTCEHVYEGALDLGVRKFARILGAVPAPLWRRPAVAPPPSDPSPQVAEPRQASPAPWLAITRAAEHRTARPVL